MDKSRLIRPLLYFKINHPAKLIYDIAIPLSIVVAFFIFFETGKITLDLTEIAKSTATLLGILPGFYIASLAAIATFNGKAVDDKLDGYNPPTLFSSENGISKKRVLTRRRFLCFLFGYLAFISILLCILNIFFLLSEKSTYCAPWGIWIKYTAIASYVYFFAHMIVTTLLGLFYLCDRLHWPQSQDPDIDNS